jgi:hypothetical protein
MLFPKNSYHHTCKCGTEFLAPKRSLHCHNCLYAEIESLKAQLDSKWISVEDRLPEFTGHVLVSYGARVTTDLYLKFKSSERHGRWGTSAGKPNSWMPLPNPPSTGK